MRNGLASRHDDIPFGNSAFEQRGEHIDSAARFIAIGEQRVEPVQMFFDQRIQPFVHAAKRFAMGR